MNTPPPSTPPPAAETGPEAKITASAPNLELLLKTIKLLFFGEPKPVEAAEPKPGDADAPKPNPPAPRWLAILAMFLRLIWPLAMLGGGIALFVVIGANGWLWLVLALVIVCGVFARPPKFPDA